MQEIPAINLSFWPILFLLAGGQSVFFAILILTNKANKRANAYLATFLFCFGFMLVFNFCYWTNAIYHFPHFLHTNLLLNYLFGPLLLLYIDAYRKQPKLQKWWWVHFLPALIYFIFLSPFYFQSATAKVNNILGNTPFPMFNLGIFKMIGRMGGFKVFSWYLLSYFIWKVYWYIQMVREEAPKGAIENLGIRKNWLKLLLALYSAFLFSYLSYFLIADQPFFRLAHDFLICTIMTLSTYTIGFIGYKRPLIFSGQLLKQIFITEKYATSTLTDAAAESIKNALLNLIAKEKPYLNNDLKMKDLAEKINTSNHHLSQVINEQFGKSFNQFINELRIQEAKKLLVDPVYKNTYIIQIAYQVGFNNKTTFNNTFKKIEGCTPKQYRNQWDSFHKKGAPPLASSQSEESEGKLFS